MSDKLIKHIMDRKMVEPPKFSIRKMLSLYDMEMYESMCVGRIIDEIGVDSVDVVFDFANTDIGLTYKGIKKSESVLLSYLNSDQMDKILDCIKAEEELAVNINNLLWVLHRKSIKKLKSTLKECGTEEAYMEIRDIIRAEIRSRSLWNKIRLFMEEHLCEVIVRVKYRKDFKIISDVIEKYANDSVYEAHLEPEERKTIIHRNYIKYRNMSRQKRSVDELKKYVFYGMMNLQLVESRFAVKIKNCYEIENQYKDMRDVIAAASELTPREFLNMFPVSKEYYGEEYGFKDYFFTMKNLDRFPMDEKIGNMIIPFLDIYYSKIVFGFLVKYVTCIDDYSLYCGINEPSDEYYSDIKSYWHQEVQA